MLMKPNYPIDAFEQFWSVYPRKASKKYALKIFERVRSSGEIPFEILMSAVKNYARSMVGKDMQYVKHPSTWLAQGCWDDAPEALLDVKVSAPVMQCADGKVLIRRGSPQALAWERYRRRSIPWGQSGVWAVDSEWPPEDK